MRWVKATIFWAGLFIGISDVNAAECPGNRTLNVKRHAVSTGATKYVRPVCTSKNRKIQNHLARRHSATLTRKAARPSVRQSRVAAVEVDKSIAKGGGSFRIGSPYKIAGRTYTPQADPNYRTEGKASWYGGEFHGRRTANGERFDAHALSAAHPTLPLPSYVRVTNLENQRSLVVRLNDRGPYRSNRLIDVSVQAAKLLGFYDRGLAQVRVEYVSKATLEGSDDAKLAATLRTEDASVMQAPAAAAAVQTETSPVSVDERVSTLAQCNRQGISGAYPKPVSDREDANCKPVLPETRTAALWPATTLTKKSYCVASLTLNQL